MTSEAKGAAFLESATAVGGLYQRFQYGFGGYIEVLLTLLQKQHWQAAADIMPLIEREKISFEGVLLGLQTELTEKGCRAEAETRAEEAGNADGPYSGEAPNSGEAAS